MVMGLGPNAGRPQDAQHRQVLRREQHVAVAPDLGTEPRVNGSPVTHSFCNNGLHCVNRIGRSRRRLTSQREGVSIEHETAPMLEPTSAASYPISARIMPDRAPSRRAHSGSCGVVSPPSPEPDYRLPRCSVTQIAELID